MIPWYPTNGEIRSLLKIIAGNDISRKSFTAMQRAINAKTGSVSAVVNWKNPDVWINDKLKGNEKETALLIWNGSGNVINPRYLDEPRRVVEKKRLTIVDENGLYRLTEYGVDFLKDPKGNAVREIDLEEGLVFILYIFSEKPGLQRKYILPVWENYLKKVAPKWKAESSITDLLSCRFRNLRERGLAKREGFNWFLTNEGGLYLKLFDLKKLGPIAEVATEKEPGTPPARQVSDHDLTQIRLAELGYLMDFSVYVAASDKSKKVGAVELAKFDMGELPARGLSRELQKSMANIDLIWFDKKDLPKAFIEIETSTGFVRNLRKINDLLSEIPPGYAHLAGVYIIGYEKDREEAEKIMWGDTFKRLEGRCREYKFIGVEEVATEYKKLKSRLDLQFRKIKEAEEEIEKRKKNIEKIKDGKFGLFALS